MKMNFNLRLQLDKIMKNTIIDMFKTFGKDKIFIKPVGQENIVLELHEHIRFKNDITTQFIRYFPDLFLCWHKEYKEISWLLELKVALTGLKKESSWLMDEFRRKIKDLKKEEILNIELGSWENLLRLKSLNINIGIVAFISYHPVDKWIFIIPDPDLNLKTISTNEMISTIGSGTPIANLFVRINDYNIFSLKNWLYNFLALNNIEILENFFLEREKEFQDIMKQLKNYRRLK